MRIFYATTGLFSLLAAIGLFIDLLFLRNDRLVAVLVLMSAPGFSAAKWSNYNSEWRWGGFFRGPNSILLIWRWGLRLLIVGVLATSLFASIRPELFRKAFPNGSEFVRVFATTFLILLNVWFCGFVLFGDQVAASSKTRSRILALGKLLFQWRKK